MKILLIDDSESIGQLVTTCLKPYSVMQAFSIAEAENALAQNDFQIILVDVLLPDGNGFEFCNRLSNDLKFRKIPRIVLTGMDQPSEVIYGFSCGADDYLIKPFSPMELKARVDRYFRDHDNEEEVFVKNNFHFDLKFQKCSLVDNQAKLDLGLTPTEFRLFLTLAKDEGRAFSRQELEQMIWKSNQTFIKIRGIDTHIAHLRQKLGDHKDVIVSVYGKGYSYDGKVVVRKLG